MPSPFHTARWTTRTVPPAPVQTVHRLLIVDDYRPGAEALAASLLLAGYDAQCVLEGPAALRVVAAWWPDIVVLDINMPGMDGYAVAREIRQNAQTQHIIIVAFTALDEMTARPEGLAAGFDAYCQKGAAPEPMLRLLESLT